MCSLTKCRLLPRRLSKTVAFVLQYLGQRWPARPGAALVLLPPPGQTLIDAGSFWSAAGHPDLTVRLPGFGLTVMLRGAATSQCPSATRADHAYHHLTSQSGATLRDWSLHCALQVGSIHEQLGRPTPFLLRYAWVHGFNSAPGNGPADPRRADSLPEEQQQRRQRPPALAYQQRGSTERHGEPAPASSYTATSRSAAKDLNEDTRQAHTASQQVALYGSQYHGEVRFADRFLQFLPTKLHHAVCQASTQCFTEAGWTMLSSTVTKAGDCRHSPW